MRALGINHIHQLNWKQGLDLYTCTECGRCKEVCPTYTTDKPLNLQEFNDSLKHELLDNEFKIIKKAKLTAKLRKSTIPSGWKPSRRRSLHSIARSSWWVM